MSLTGSCFSSESAPGPFHHGIRRRGGTILWAAFPERQVQADIRTHLIHRPARDILPLLGGSRVFSYRIDLMCRSCCYGFPGPAELGAVNPDAVHDHGQPARRTHPTKTPTIAVTAGVFLRCGGGVGLLSGFPSPRKQLGDLAG